MVQGEFAAGAALGRGFGIWVKNLPSFLILSLICYSPLLIYTAMALSGELSLESITKWGYVSLAIGLPAQFVATAAILYGVIQQLRGQHAGIGPSLGMGLKRLFPVLGVGIVVGLAVIAGMIALIVPGIIIYCMLYVAVPASVIERPGIGGALKRSQELTSGYKVQIFGIILILFLIGFVVDYVLKSSMVKPETMTLSDLKTYFWVSVGIDIVLASLGSAINGVVYHDLRVAKEGVATEDLAKVFE